MLTDLRQTAKKAFPYKRHIANVYAFTSGKKSGR